MSSDATTPRRAGFLACGAVIGAALSVLAAVPVCAGPASEAPGAAAPVIVGDGPDLDACGSVAVVSGLDPNGASALSVRSGPGLGHERVDIVSSGQQLWICGRQDRWYAVVYPRGDEDCGVSAPINPAAPYAGPCRQGWVFDAYVTIIAG
jgi:hypothetical protein